MNGICWYLDLVEHKPRGFCDSPSDTSLLRSLLYYCNYRQYSSLTFKDYGDPVRMIMWHTYLNVLVGEC